MLNKYSIGLNEIDDKIGGIKKGSIILLIGPSICGKKYIFDHIIHSNAFNNENALIAVTTCEPAIRMIERIKGLEPNLLLSRLGIVDCVSMKCGIKEFENNNIEFVNGPDDLTSIGVKISQFYEDFYLKKKIQNIYILINSLSTLLMYSKIQTVFRFLHAFTSRIKMVNALGIYVIDSEMHDQQIISTIKQLCDGMIEVKSENDKNYIRTVGILPEPTPWLEYKAKSENIKIVKADELFGGKNSAQNSFQEVS